MAIEEELSLNVENAIDAIGKMAQNLQDALVSFFVAFDDAVQQLSQSTIPLPFQPEIEGGPIDAFAPEEDVTIVAGDADASGAASDIESAIGSVDPTINATVDGDASGLAEEIQDATTIDESPELVVGVALDQEAAQANAEAFRDQVEEPIDIPVNSDGLAEARNDADGLADSLDGASSSASETADNVRKGADETKNAKKEAEELELTWQKLAVVSAQAFAAAVGAAAGFIAGFASAAIESESTLISLNQQLGSLGQELLDINVAGFSGDLQQLAQDLGSSDEAAVRASQRLGLLGQTSGATSEAIKETNSNLVGVAASIRAANPAAGELDEIMGRLTTGLARGGRAAAGLGISLTSQEIKAKAATMTGKGLNAQFDQFELVSAGAAIAAEQFGDSIQTNIAQASKNPQIALERLGEVFGDTLEEFGKPFVSPLLSLADELLPVVLSVIEVFADLSAAFIPVVEQVSKSVQPLVREFVEWAEGSTQALEPALQSVAKALKVIFDIANPLLNVLFELNEIIFNGFAVLLQVAAEAIVALDTGGVTLILTLYGLKTAFDNLNRAQEILSKITNANPWFLLATALVTVVGLFQKLNKEPEPFEDFVDNVTETLKVLNDVAPAIAAFNKGLEDYIANSQIINNQDLVRALSETGISVAQFAEWGAAGDRGLRQFVASLIAAGDASFTYETNPLDPFNSETVQITLDNLNDLTDAELRFAFATRDTSGAANLLGDEFFDLQSRTNSSAEALFNLGVSTAGLSEEAKDLLIGTNRLADGTIDYQGALADLEIVTRNATSAQQEQKRVSGEAAEENRLFAESVSAAATMLASGAVTAETFFDAFEDEDLGEVFSGANLSIEQAQQLIEALSEEMDAFVGNATSKVPTVAEAFKDLGPENTAQSLIDSFNTQIEETNRWNAEMTRLRREGQSDILKVVAELGPQQGLLLLDTYRDNETILADHLRNMAAAEQAALQATREVAVLNWLKTREITGDAAEAVVKQLEDKLVLGDATEASIQGAIEAVQTKSPELAEAFGEAGADAVDSLTVESVEELQAKADELNQAVEAVWSGAGGVAETASRIAAETGVNKFNEIISTGFLNEATALAIIGRTAGFFSASGLGVGSAFAEGIRLGYRFNEESIIGTIIISTDNIYARTFSSAIEVGNDIGSAIVNGIRLKFFSVKNDGTLAESFADVLNGFAEDIKFSAFSTGGGIGNSLIEGILNALRSGSSSVSQAAAQIIADAEAAAKEEAESDSPSRVWERLGRDLVSGLTNGLRGSGFLAANAAAGVIGQATPAASVGGGNTISISVPVTVSGNVDPALGTEIGGRAAAEISRVLRLEAMVS